LLSQGTNQIFFDSKVYEKMPSQYLNGQYNSNHNNTTLNNVFPIMSTSEE